MSGETGGGLTAEELAHLYAANLSGDALAAVERILAARLADANARLAAVEAVHVRDGAPNRAGGTSYFCGHCSALAQEYVNWPCPTIAALHPNPSPVRRTISHVEEPDHPVYLDREPVSDQQEEEPR